MDSDLDHSIKELKFALFLSGGIPLKNSDNVGDSSVLPSPNDFLTKIYDYLLASKYRLTRTATLLIL